MKYMNKNLFFLELCNCKTGDLFLKVCFPVLRKYKDVIVCREYQQNNFTDLKSLKNKTKELCWHSEYARVHLAKISESRSFCVCK